MATAPTAGYVYFIESTNGVDDWITDHAGDPDLIDISLATEGTHYCKIEIPQRIQSNFWIGATVTDSGSGNSFDLRWNRKGYQIPIQGWQTSRTNAFYINKFLMSDRHTSGASATFKDYYLVIYFGVNDHWKFIDASDNEKSYCKGLVLNGNLTWVQNKPSVMRFSGVFRSVW
jgi:hypothetical protein